MSLILYYYIAMLLMMLMFEIDTEILKLEIGILTEHWHCESLATITNYSVASRLVRIQPHIQPAAFLCKCHVIYT
jgi:hypothetical protein